MSACMYYYLRLRLNITQIINFWDENCHIHWEKLIFNNRENTFCIFKEWSADWREETAGGGAVHTPRQVELSPSTSIGATMLEKQKRE